MTDSNERRRILAIARGSIESAFTGTGMEIPVTDKRLGAFVTLRKDHALRGCIGFLVGIMPLYEEIAQLAREAAFEDPRFPPLQERELDSIIIEVSLLSVPERIDSPGSFVPGRDGIIMTNGRHRAVFLPQVADETGWSREEMLTALSRKAGLDGNAWKSQKSIFETFQAEVFDESNV